MLTKIHNYKIIYLSFLLIYLISCSTSGIEKPVKKLSQEGFKNLLGTEYPIKYTSKVTDRKAVIAIEYQFKKSSSYQHFIIKIFFSEPGKMLVKSEYLSRMKNYFSENSIEQYKIKFPSIGSQAMYTFLGAGPGGSAEQLIFTDTRKRHDIKIIISHLLPNDVELHPVALENIANYIDDALLNGQYVEKNYD